MELELNTICVMASLLNLSGRSLVKIPDYSKEYLTFTAVTTCQVKFTGTTASGVLNQLQYSTNKGNTWTTLPDDTYIPLASGDSIILKGSCNPTNNGIGTFASSDGTFEVSGNVMSLLYEDNYIGRIILTKNFSFGYLFKDCTGITNAGNLMLLASTLTYGCYYRMFWGCTSLTTAPELPATTLADCCYTYMFQNCTSLTSTPALPATTLSVSCYNGMFRGCTSLISIPDELPVTALTQGCYSEMFRGCTSLTKAPILPATTGEGSCYLLMFYGCSSLNYIKCLLTNIPANATLNWVFNVSSSGTFVKAANMNDWTRDISGIPTNWTVEDYVEETN